MNIRNGTVDTTVGPTKYVAVGLTLNQRLGFGWRMVSVLAGVLPTSCAMFPQKIIPRAKVPLKCNFANKIALFSSSSTMPFFNPGQNDHAFYILN